MLVVSTNRLISVGANRVTTWRKESKEEQGGVAKCRQLLSVTVTASCPAFTAAPGSFVRVCERVLWEAASSVNATYLTIVAVAVGAGVRVEIGILLLSR